MHDWAIWLILIYFTIETLISTVKYIERDNSKPKATSTLLAFALRIAVIVFAIAELL